MTYIFEDVYVTGARFSRTKSFKAKKEKAKREEKEMETIGRRRRTKSSALGIESSKFGCVPGVRF